MDGLFPFWEKVVLLTVLVIVFVVLVIRSLNTPPRERGQDAFWLEETLNDNPHKEGTEDHAEWEAGFKEEQDYLKTIDK